MSVELEVTFETDDQGYLDCIHANCPYSNLNEDGEMECNAGGDTICNYEREAYFADASESRLFTYCTMVFYKRNNLFDYMWQKFMNGYFRNGFANGVDMQTVEIVLNDMFPDEKHIWSNDLIIYKAMKD